MSASATQGGHNKWTYKIMKRMKIGITMMMVMMIMKMVTTIS